MDNREKGELILAVLRIAMGWMMLWGFLDKMFGLGFETPPGSGVIDGVSPSSAVVYVAGGVFKDLFTSLAGNAIVDFLLMAGLLVIGITLILGFASKLTSVALTAFLATMFLLKIPPTDNPLMDYHIVMILATWAIYFLGGYERLSIQKKWKELSIVKRFPILE